jgi:hypothetical protein
MYTSHSYIRYGFLGCRLWGDIRNEDDTHMILVSWIELDGVPLIGSEISHIMPLGGPR